MGPWDTARGRRRGSAAPATREPLRIAGGHPDPPEERFAEVHQAPVDRYGRPSADSAMRALGRPREAAGRLDALPAVRVAEPIPVEQVRGPLGWAFRGTSGDDPMALARLPAGPLGGLVRQRGREPVRDTTVAAGTRSARPPGARACAFRLMPASRARSTPGRARCRWAGMPSGAGPAGRRGRATTATAPASPSGRTPSSTCRRTSRIPGRTGGSPPGMSGAAPVRGSGGGGGGSSTGPARPTPTADEGAPGAVGGARQGRRRIRRHRRGAARQPPRGARRARHGAAIPGGGGGRRRCGDPDAAARGRTWGNPPVAAVSGAPSRARTCDQRIMSPRL